MPELPEVETIKNQLNQKLKGKRIEKVEVRLPKMVKLSLSKFKKIVQGQKIINFDRRGKLLIINLSNGYSLVIHLKLSGQLIVNGEPNKHTHFIYCFTDGSSFIHNDLRQFGYVKPIKTKELNEIFEKEKLGPEPLDKKFTPKLFEELLSKRKKSKIKTLLMDQSFIVGIGNIYASEILFEAKISPLRMAGDLNEKEIKALFQAIKKILKLAIRKKGTSANDYLDAFGKEGDFLKIAKVYQKDGRHCFRCPGKVKRIKMNTRSTFYCPKCQR